MNFSKNNNNSQAEMIRMASEVKSAVSGFHCLLKNTLFTVEESLRHEMKATSNTTMSRHGFGG